MMARIVIVGVGLALCFSGCRENVEGARPPTPSEPQYTVNVSTNRVRVGDVFHVVYKALLPVGVRMEFPEITQSDKAWVQRDFHLETNNLTGGGREVHGRYTVTSFRTGSHVLSNLQARLEWPDGNVVTQRLPVLSMSVDTVLTQGEKTPSAPLKSTLARWPDAFPRWIWALPLVVLLAVVSALLFRRLRRRAETTAAAPLCPPDELAMQALRALLGKGWIENHQIEPYYVELSAIVRRYIENRFGLRAPERTTEEFIREMVTARFLNAEQRQCVRDFLEQCDLVKFARHEPLERDMREAFDSAERLVKETRVVSVAVVAPGGESTP